MCGEEMRGKGKIKLGSHVLPHPSEFSNKNRNRTVFLSFFLLTPDPRNLKWLYVITEDNHQFRDQVNQIDRMDQYHKIDR